MLQKTLNVSIDSTTFPGGALPPGFVTGNIVIDMQAALLMLGCLTVPNGFSIASPALYWSWVRYFTALSSTSDLRITSPFAALDPHQIGVLSDDFGVAVCTQWLWQVLNGFKAVIDGRRFVLQYAHLLTHDVQAPTKIGSRKCPDFVMQDNSDRWHVIECKGTQTSRGYSMSQLARAREQKQAIEIAPALAGTRLAAGLYLVSEDTSEHSGMTIQDPSEISALIMIADNDRANKVANRITASRSLGLAGFTPLAEELGFVDITADYLQKLLTADERRRGATPRLERSVSIARDLNGERASFIVDGRSYIGRQYSTEVRMQSDSYAPRKVTLRHGVASELIDIVRSSSIADLLDTVEDIFASTLGQKGILLKSNADQVSLSQSSMFSSSLSFD